MGLIELGLLVSAFIYVALDMAVDFSSEDERPPVD